MNDSAHMSHANGRGGDAGYCDAFTCCAYAAWEAYCAVAMLDIAEGDCGDDDSGGPYALAIACVCEYACAGECGMPCEEECECEYECE